MIKLDWDNIAWQEAQRRINFIRQHNFIKDIDVRESPSGTGYHIRIETLYPLSTAFIFRLRRRFKDDGNRIVMDILFRRDGIPKDILFIKKRYTEIKMSMKHQSKLTNR